MGEFDPTTLNRHGEDDRRPRHIRYAEQELKKGRTLEMHHETERAHWATGGLGYDACDYRTACKIAAFVRANAPRMIAEVKGWTFIKGEPTAAFRGGIVPAAFPVSKKTKPKQPMLEKPKEFDAVEMVKSRRPAITLTKQWYTFPELGEMTKKSDATFRNASDLLTVEERKTSHWKPQQCVKADDRLIQVLDTKGFRGELDIKEEGYPPADAEEPTVPPMSVGTYEEFDDAGGDTSPDEPTPEEETMDKENQDPEAVRVTRIFPPSGDGDSKEPVLLHPEAGEITSDDFELAAESMEAHARQLEEEACTIYLRAKRFRSMAHFLDQDRK